jgi:hypothetical protein
MAMMLYDGQEWLMKQMKLTLKVKNINKYMI